ncbi:PHP domain-containing protein [Seleniivibrio woodruffii]|uniref:PHP domain-containing protein n=1 Tax=Seleniivibrio woodruffii TaxID=1078050 RepID=UPI0024096010|nr:PHP domain-containing protein [Seleniivibrio woodruffii]
MEYSVGSFDLHMHSSHSSDGVLSPAQLLTIVRTRNISTFSITDHNTLAACNEMKWNKGRYGSKTMFINGVELSTFHGDREIHVCAYGFNESCHTLLGILETFKRNRDLQTQMRVEKLQDMGFVLDYEELNKSAGGKTPSGVTFLTVLSKHKENAEKLYDYLEGEKSLSPFTNFYFDYFVKGGKAWVDVRMLDYYETIEKLKDKAVLCIAHPGLYKDREIDELITDGISCIEAYSTYHSPEQVQKYLDAAKKHNLLVTAGSDFHGDRIKPGIHIGGHGCTDSSVIDPFIERVVDLKYGFYFI